MIDRPEDERPEKPDALLALPQGSVFRKVDLHVHTPGSADMHPDWKDATPADVVRFASACDLDAVAVTELVGCLPSALCRSSRNVRAAIPTASAAT